MGLIARKNAFHRLGLSSLICVYAFGCGGSGGGPTDSSGGALGAGGLGSGGVAGPVGGGIGSGGRPAGGGSNVGTGGGSSSGGGANPGGGSGGIAGGGTGGGGDPAGGASPAGGSASGGETAAGGQPGTGGGNGLPPEVDCPETFQNPVIWEDLPDVEVIRVGETFYYTASTFAQSPGAPILRSYDLVNWEYVGHSVPVLDFDDAYNLNGERAYVSGIWASTLQYRESNETFYWMGCMRIGGGYAFTSKSPMGPWEKHRTQGCYYDMGLLIDDDDKMYVASGNNTISVAELSADGFSQVRTQQVYQTPSSVGGPLEGARFKKIDGRYYIFLTQYANGEYVLRADSPFGPYEMKPFAVKLPYGGKPGSGGAPHQGGLVETAKGDWYYMAFNDSYPSGRIPVLAPVVWTDGWPTVTLVNNQWGGTYPFPDVTCRAIPARPTEDTFSDEVLRPEWEWNHNPDNTKWSAGDGLTLSTATVTNDLYAARNTLTRRIAGPVSTGTIELDFSTMNDGDVAGLAAFRDVSAWIGVKKASGAYRVVMTSGVNMTAGQWTTSSTGNEVAAANLSGTKVWLRVEANVRSDAGGATARFSYSTNGTDFTSLGNTLSMTKDWQYFLGYRFGIFNYATSSLGGSVKVASFKVSTQ
jgi:beta-xylosidase